MRESAAAWGAALNLIPSLGPVIEGYLKKDEGRRLVKAIKDPQQHQFEHEHDHALGARGGGGQRCARVLGDHSSGHAVHVRDCQ